MDIPKTKREDYDKLIKLLPPGYGLKLAKEFNVTNVTVCNSLKGKTKRFDILKRAIEMATENANILNQLKSL